MQISKKNRKNRIKEKSIPIYKTNVTQIEITIRNDKLATIFAENHSRITDYNIRDTVKTDSKGGKREKKREKERGGERAKNKIIEKQVKEN